MDNESRQQDKAEGSCDNREIQSLFENDKKDGGNSSLAVLNLGLSGRGLKTEKDWYVLKGKFQLIIGSFKVGRIK